MDICASLMLTARKGRQGLLVTRIPVRRAPSLTRVRPSSPDHPDRVEHWPFGERHVECASANLRCSPCQAIGRSIVASTGRQLVTLHSRADDSFEAETLYVPDLPQGLVDRVLEAAGVPVLICTPEQGPQVADILRRNGTIDVRRVSSVQAVVRVDGAIVEPQPEVGQPLVDASTWWLTKLAGLALELHGSRFATVTERVVQDALARLRRVRLIWGRQIEILVEGESILLPPPLDRSIHINDDDHPLLIVRSEGTRLDWEVLEVAADSLCELVRQPAASETLRLASLRLQARLSGEWREPSEADLAHALRQPQQRIEEIVAGLSAELDQLIWLLTPAVAHKSDIESARSLAQSRIEDVGQLQARLSEVLGSEDAAMLLDMCGRALTVADIQRYLEVPLAEFNRILRALERPPLHFRDEHISAFRNYVSAHRSTVLDALRNTDLDRFERFELPLPYADLRALPELAPDPGWLDDYVEVPDELMFDHIEKWLASHDIDVSRSDTARLVGVDEVREGNQSLLRERLGAIRQNVRAWCLKHGSETPQDWTELSSVRGVLEASGCLEFVILSQTDLIRWLNALELWPVGMPLTTDTSQLDLSDADLEESSGEQERLKADRARARRTISLDGREFDTEAEDLHMLVEAVRASVDDRFLSSSRRLKRLESPAPRGRMGRNERGSTPRQGGGRVGERGTEAQRAAIGLVGELLAYEWLRHVYPELTSDAWVSGYRESTVGGVQGDDLLGFDFEVPLRTRTLQFEVKATAGDQCEFEMGQSELRAAGNARKGAYRIIFIRNVLDSSERELMVLPNPLEDEYARKFRQSSGGIRFAFESPDPG